MPHRGTGRGFWNEELPKERFRSQRLEQSRGLGVEPGCGAGRCFPTQCGSRA